MVRGIFLRFADLLFTLQLLCLALSTVVTVFELFDHSVHDIDSFLRRIIGIRIHFSQEIIKNLQYKRLCDSKTHMLSKIRLIGERTGISAESHAKNYGQMIPWLF